MAPEKVPYPNVYGFWTNKGGVGKTTLCFHMATVFAELFPEKEVIVIDMCPQSNLSATLLTRTTQNDRIPGDSIVKEIAEKKDNWIQDQIPQTIVGRFISKLRGEVVPADEFLINLAAGNRNIHVPSNLYLVCGHHHLDNLATELNIRASGPCDEFFNAYVDTHYYLRRFIQELADYFAERKKEIIVFIDTNPAFSIYTQIALCAMTELVIPVNADTFSLQAVNGMFNLVYGLYPTASPVAKVYEKKSFAYKAKEYNMHLPVITAIIHNRFDLNDLPWVPWLDDRNPIVTNNAQDGGPRASRAVRAMAAEQVTMLYDGYEAAKKQGVLDRVFKIPGASSDGSVTCGTKQAFAESYTAQMRDMMSCGVAAVHSGFPVYKLLSQFKCIDSQFRNDGFKQCVPSLLQDLLGAMEVVFGSMWHQRDEEAKARLEAIINQQNGVQPPMGAPAK